MSISIIKLATNSATIIGGIMLAAMAIHINLIPILNIVEDESAYMQDAWQASAKVLPFREFGATKGPVFLYLLKGWQVLLGQTIFASRLFSSLFHVMSIPLLYLVARRLTNSTTVGIVAAILWGLSAAPVSLTTNVMHFSLELTLILLSLWLVSGNHVSRRDIIIAAFFFFLATLTRATAISALPIILTVLIIQTKSWRSVIMFCLVGAFLLAMTIAIIYPLYGWPKTAFFFNADATLIANDQRTAYTQESVSPQQQLFRGFIPLWYEGLPLVILAIGGIGLSFRAGTWYLKLAFLSALITGAYYLYGPVLNNIGEYWSGDAMKMVRQYANISYLGLFAICGLTLLSYSGSKINQKRDSTSKSINIPILRLAIWLGSVLVFYHYWGREPTPYYVLEAIPPLAIAAGITSAILFKSLWSMRLPGTFPLSILMAAFLIFSITYPYLAISDRQYRGTITTRAALKMAEQIKNLVAENETIFTAQPVFAFLGHRSLYGLYTHPGWYLAERAGFMPASIRRIYFPDLPDLTSQVARDVNWIVVDWRTTDVYFNPGAKETQPLRTLLEQDFEPIVTVSNEPKQPIILYHKKN